MQYFPDQLEENFKQVQDFYNYMVENRGKYFKNKYETTKIKINELTTRRKKLEKDTEQCMAFFNDENIIASISEINRLLLEKNHQLSEVNHKIAKYEERNKLNADKNNLQNQINLLTEKRNDDFQNYQDHIQSLRLVFNELLENVYNEKGILEFEFNNDTKLQSTTGRIIINCYIDDENSHGRLYMKINIMDLTWFLSRMYKNINEIQFLIHDGSYSKPDNEKTVTLLKDIQGRLKEIKRGQYIVTLNSNDLAPEVIKDFESEGLIITHLNRSDGHRNRFFGFKY